MIVLENKKKKIKIADLIDNEQRYDEWRKLHEKSGNYYKKFKEFKSDYERLKEQEPLKSKIETLKKVFSFDEKNYNAQNPGPSDEEIDLVKDLCLSKVVRFDYYKALSIEDKNQKPIFFREDNEPTQIKAWKDLLRLIKIELFNAGVFGFNGDVIQKMKGKLNFDDEAIKNTIYLLPSFETYFQKQKNIEKPEEVDGDFNYLTCSITELIEADDFVYSLTNKKEKLKLCFEKRYVEFDNDYKEQYRSRCPIEIESSLLSLLQDNTLEKFNTAEELLNFYYDSELNRDSHYNMPFKPYFSFAYKIVDLFDKKLETVNRKFYAQRWEKLRRCIAKCAEETTPPSVSVRQNVQEIFRYIDMFEKQDTASFNLTDEVLKDINGHIGDIFEFMEEQGLIDKADRYFHNDNFLDLGNINNSWILNLDNISPNGWDCFCEFMINFFTHFIALWDGILFNGRLKIDKSAQLRKFVNFLRETQINQVPSDLTSADFAKQRNCSRTEIQFLRYDQTNIFQALTNLRMTLSEKPKSENNQPDDLLSQK